LLLLLQHGYNYGSPDYVDILPPSCSGLCLAAVINLCFEVLAYLQPNHLPGPWCPVGVAVVAAAAQHRSSRP
jgi:hypothetical protein